MEWDFSFLITIFIFNEKSYSEKLILIKKIFFQNVTSNKKSLKNRNLEKCLILNEKKSMKNIWNKKSLLMKNLEYFI